MADTDSDDHQVTYILKEDPGAGRLQMLKQDDLAHISVKGPIRSFTQADLSQGQLLPFCPRTRPETPPSVTYDSQLHTCVSNEELSYSFIYSFLSLQFWGF